MQSTESTTASLASQSSSTAESVTSSQSVSSSASNTEAESEASSNWIASTSYADSTDSVVGGYGWVQITVTSPKLLNVKQGDTYMIQIGDSTTFDYDTTPITTDDYTVTSLGGGTYEFVANADKDYASFSFTISVKPKEIVTTDQTIEVPVTISHDGATISLTTAVNLTPPATVSYEESHPLVKYVCFGKISGTNKVAWGLYIDYNKADLSDLKFTANFPGQTVDKSSIEAYLVGDDEITDANGNPLDATNHTYTNYSYDLSKYFQDHSTTSGFSISNSGALTVGGTDMSHQPMYIYFTTTLDDPSGSASSQLELSAKGGSSTLNVDEQHSSGNSASSSSGNNPTSNTTSTADSTSNSDSNSESTSASSSASESTAQSSSLSENESLSTSGSASMSVSTSVSTAASVSGSASSSVSESASDSQSQSTSESVSQSTSASINDSDSLSVSTSDSISLSASTSESQPVSGSSSLSVSTSNSNHPSASVSESASNSFSDSDSASLPTSASASQSESLSTSGSISQPVSTSASISFSTSTSESQPVSESGSVSISTSRSDQAPTSVSESVSDLFSTVDSESGDSESALPPSLSGHYSNAAASPTQSTSTVTSSSVNASVSTSISSSRSDESSQSQSESLVLPFSSLSSSSTSTFAVSPVNGTPSLTATGSSTGSSIDGKLSTNQNKLPQTGNRPQHLSVFALVALVLGALLAFLPFVRKHHQDGE